MMERIPSGNFHGQHDFGPGMEGRCCPFLAGAVEFNRHQVERFPFYRPSGKDLERAGGFLLEDDSLADAQVVEAMEAEAGIAVKRAVGEPFDDHRHGQHRFAVQDMGAEERVVIDREGEGEGFGKGCFPRAGGGGYRMCLAVPASTTTSTGPAAAAISRTSSSLPAARSMRPIPSPANTFFRAGVTMPPSHGPQLMLTSGSRGAGAPPPGPFC